MPKPTPVDSKRSALISPRRDDRWLRLRFNLTRAYTGGELVQFADNALDGLQGACALASAYREPNWTSGIASGAFYAFRALDLTRQHVFVSELSGLLRAEDMEALAYATAMQIASLAEKHLPMELSEGWVLEHRIVVDSQTPDPMPAQGVIPSKHPTQPSKFPTPA